MRQALALLVVVLLLAPAAALGQTVQPNQICRAAIATITDQPVRIMDASAYEEKGIVLVDFLRLNDGQKESYLCRVKGRSIQWARQGGRWHPQGKETRISYTVKREQLFITEQPHGGTRVTTGFPLSELK